MIFFDIVATMSEILQNFDENYASEKFEARSEDVSLLATYLEAVVSTDPRLSAVEEQGHGIVLEDDDNTLWFYQRGTSPNNEFWRVTVVFRGYKGEKNIPVWTEALELWANKDWPINNDLSYDSGINLFQTKTPQDHLPMRKTYQALRHGFNLLSLFEPASLHQAAPVQR